MLRRKEKKVRIKLEYLYITTSNCINNEITTLLYLLNSFIRRRYREIVIINNNKVYSNELFSTYVKEISTIKYMLKTFVALIERQRVL